MKIDTICNSLLETLIQAGYNENTIFNYRGVIRRFKAFCKEKEAFEYTPELGQSYADDVISKKNREVQQTALFLTGKVCKIVDVLLLHWIFRPFCDETQKERARKSKLEQTVL